MSKSKQIDLAAAAREAASLFGRSDELETRACELIWKTDERLGDDAASREGFRMELTKLGLLPRRDGAISTVSASTYSMLCAVGENADLLRLPEVRKALGGPGYSKKYQTILLYKRLTGSRSERIKKLVQLLTRHGSTRDAIAERVKANKNAETKATKANGAGGETNRTRYEVVACMPSPSDLKAISATYSDPDTLRRALGLYDNLTDAAAAVVFAPVRSLSAITEKMFPASGFSSAKYVFLLRRPESPSLIDSEVAVIGERGASRHIKPASVDWLANGDPVDRVAYVERMTPDSKSRLLMFSSDRRSGWHTATWAEEPTL